MSETAPSAKAGFEIVVAKDGSCATLVAPAGAAVSARDVIANLKAMKITSFDDGAIIEAIDARSLSDPLDFVVARHEPAVSSKPGKVEYRVPIPEGPAFTFTTVEAGQFIATISQGIAGKDGKDLYGNCIPADKLQAQLKIGPGVVLRNGEVVTNARGSLLLKEGQLSVRPLLSISNGERPPEKFDGDVVVKGSLADGQPVCCTGDLLINGAVEAADIHSEGSTHVKGAVIGRLGSKIFVGGDFCCRLISGAQIIVGGSVIVGGELAKSRLFCGGKLTAARGPVYGGRISATGGIHSAVVGIPSGLPTLIEAGLPHTHKLFVLDLTRKISALKKRSAEIQQKVQPLMSYLRSLSAQQREKVTELMAQRDEIDVEVGRLAQQLESLQLNACQNSCPQVEVSELVHAGVTVRLMGYQTTLSSSIQGPVSFGLDKVNGQQQIILKETASRKTRSLPTTKSDSDNAVGTPRIAA